MLHCNMSESNGIAGECKRNLLRRSKVRGAPLVSVRSRVGVEKGDDLERPGRSTRGAAQGEAGDPGARLPEEDVERHRVGDGVRWGGDC